VKGETMKKRFNMKKIMAAILMCLMFTLMMSMTVGATGNVAGAVEDTWDEASDQIKTVVDNVVFPCIDMILAVCFFAKLGMAYFDYKKHGQFEWAPPAILFVCLILTLTAPMYIWRILGM